MVQSSCALTLPSLRDLGLLDVQPAPDPTASISSKSARPPLVHDSGPPSHNPMQYSSPFLKALRASHHPSVPVPAPRNGQLPSNSLPSPYSRIQAYVGPRASREPLTGDNRMHPYRRLASLPSVPPDFAFPTSANRRCLSLPESKRPSLPAENVRMEMFFPMSGQRSTIGAMAGLAGTNGGRQVGEQSHVVSQQPPSFQSHTAMTRLCQHVEEAHVEEAGANADGALLVPWHPLANASNPSPVRTNIRIPLNLLHSTLLLLVSKRGGGRPGEDQAVAELLRAVERMERSRGGRIVPSRRGSAGIEHPPSSLRLFFPPAPATAPAPSLFLTPTSAERPGVAQVRARPLSSSSQRSPAPRATYGAPVTPPTPSPLASSRRPSLVVQMEVDHTSDARGATGQAMRGTTAGYVLGPGPASVQSRVR